MKQLLLIILVIFLFGCNNKTAPLADNRDPHHDTLMLDSSSSLSPAKKKEKPLPQDIFRFSDAEKILGEPAAIKDSSVSKHGGVWTYNCSYMAKSRDKKSGKTGNIYFMFERYELVDSAKKHYTDIKKANEDHGIVVLDKIGDEAYYHSDKENFYFILARKGKDMFRMKVNKITSHTSKDEFNRIAGQVMDSL